MARGKIPSKVVYDLEKISEFPVGTVITAKHGILFDMGDDYYDAGLIIPLLSKGIPKISKTFMEAIVKAYSEEELRKEIGKRAREFEEFDHPKTIPSSLEDIYILYSKRKGGKYWFYHQQMPKDRLLLCAEIPIPEDGYLAMMFASYIEKNLSENSFFKSLLRKWNK